MKDFKADLVKELSELYTVKVRTSYHLQIEIADGHHNIWFTKGEYLRFMPFGSSETDLLSKKELKARLASYDYAKSDLATMRDLSTFIREIDGRTGVFVDAGWKDGKARMAIIHATGGGSMDIRIREFEADSSMAAEKYAIEMAIRLYPTSMIYSDCQVAVKDYTAAVWIPRGKNKEADHFGNMRSK